MVKGLEEMMNSGSLAGFPVVDVTATLYDGGYHEVDSSVLAFQIAARGAFRSATPPLSLMIDTCHAGQHCRAAPKGVLPQLPALAQQALWQAVLIRIPNLRGPARNDQLARRIFSIQCCVEKQGSGGTAFSCSVACHMCCTLHASQMREGRMHQAPHHASAGS